METMKIEEIKKQFDEQISAIKVGGIDDLSYSGLVNVIQNDTDTGLSVITACAKELELVRYVINALERKLQSLKGRESSLVKSSHTVADHIKLSLPLIIIRNDYVVKVTGYDLMIDRNVIIKVSK